MNQQQKADFDAAYAEMDEVAQAAFDEMKRNPFELNGISFTVGKLPYIVGKKVARVMTRHPNALAMGVLPESEMSLLEELLFPYISFQPEGTTMTRVTVDMNEEMATAGDPTAADDLVWRALWIGCGDFLIARSYRLRQQLPDSHLQSR